MATKYWTAGGSGNWSDSNNWSTTSGSGRTANTTAPGTTDAAVFDAISGSGTATLDISPTIQTLTCTGFTGTLAFGTNTISLNSTGTIFTGATTMSVSGTPLIICTNSSASARTITTGLVTEANSISFRVTAGTGNMTFTTNQTAVRNLDFTDGVNPTGFAGSYANTSNTIYGNLKASTGMAVTTGTGGITFASTSGTKTINTASVTFDRPFAFNGAGGTFQLVGALTSGNTRTCTLTAGTLDLNNNTLTIGQFSSNNANVRTLAFGSSGSISLTSASTTSNLTVFTTSDSTNLTVTGTYPYIDVYGGSSGFIRSILPGLVSSGGTQANAISFYFNSGTDTISFGTTNRVFKDIQLNGFTGNIAADAAPYIYGFFFNAATITGGTNAWVFKATSTGNSIFSVDGLINNPVIFDGIGGGWELISGSGLTINGAVTLINGTLKILAGTTLTVGSFVTSGTNQKYLQSTTAGSQATISDASGTNSVSYLTIKDSNATGGATFNAFYDLGNINAGNNSGWYFGDSPTLGNEITMRLRSFTQPRRF